ncbi:MAG: hypothetical protein AABX11_00485 [Nanoarchaeota archaeon]|mgnify:CR=1 FL=1
MIKQDIIGLRYQLELQKVQASLTLLTVGVLAFLGTFIWYANRIVFGIAISLIVILISLIFYNKTKKRMNLLIENRLEEYLN